MTTRILPREEYSRLGAELAWDTLPIATKVLVVEQDGEIIGRWMALPVVHLEAVWKRPDAGSGVGRRLLAGMRTLLKSEGVAGAWTSSLSTDVEQLLTHLSAERVPGDHYFVRL